MADNTVLNSGTGGNTLRTLDDGSVHWPVGVVAYATTVGTPDVLTIPTAAALADNTSNPTTLLTGACMLNFDGSTWDRVKGDSTDGLLVNLGSNNDVTNGGTFAVQVDGDALTALQLIDDAVYTDGSGTPSKGIAAMGTDGTNPQLLSTTTSGHLHIHDGGNTITVDGTVTANLSATDNAVLDSIDSAVNGTLTVGSHAVTNAGTFAVQVDGDALTALQLIDDPVFADDAAFTLTSSKVVMQGAIRDDSLTTLSAAEGDAVPLRVGSTGALHVTGAGGGTQYNVDDASGGTDTGTMALAVRDDSLTTLTPADGDYVPLRVSSTGALHVTGGGGGTEYNEDDASPGTITGTATMMERDDALSTLTPAEGDWSSLRSNARGALWVELDLTNDVTIADGGNSITVDGTVTANLSATDNAVLDNIQAAVELIDNAISGSEMQVDVVGALPAGTNAIGKLAANDGVDIGDVDVASIAAGSNLIGDVGLQPRTSGGLTIFRSIDLDESEEEIKATAGQVYAIMALNLASGVRYLKLYNATAATVVVGTTTPVMTIPLPTQGDTNGAGLVLNIPQGIAFGTAITAAATTGVADADTGAPGANEVIVNILYK